MAEQTHTIRSIIARRVSIFAKKSISRIFSVLFAITFILSVTPGQAAQAAGVRYAKPGGTGDCSNWANACELQTALTGVVSGNEIWVKAGTYKPTMGTDRTATFQLIDGVAVYGGFAGGETARSQRNPATNVTILSGDLLGNDVGFTNNDENSYHVVTGTTFATLDGFTISGGNANGDYNPINRGGGIYGGDEGMILTNVTFSDNYGFVGGGMYNEGSPTLTNVTFSDNQGGGMYNEGSPTLMNVTFSGNQGGGMENNYYCIPILTNVTFSGNQDGGMINEEGSSPILTNVTFSGNSAFYGGGMINEDGSSPSLTNVTFSGNSATNYGGGMYNIGSNPQIHNTIFWGDTAPSGGAQIYNDSDSTPSVSDSVVQGGYRGGTNIITADPMLGALGDYGGVTQTIPLLASSSAIDMGNNAVCPTTDQRGYKRPVDGDGNGSAICDIGAYEFGSVPPLPPQYVFLPLVQKNGPTLTPTTTPTSTPTTPPPSGPKNGGWSVSSSNVPINTGLSGFRVSSGSITQFGVWIFPSSNPCTFLADYSNSVSISGKSFSFSTWGGDYTVSGSFSSSTTASGNIHIYNNDFSNPACTLFSVNYSGSWSGTWVNP